MPHPALFSSYGMTVKAFSSGQTPFLPDETMLRLTAVRANQPFAGWEDGSDEKRWCGVREARQKQEYKTNPKTLLKDVCYKLIDFLYAHRVNIRNPLRKMHNNV